MASVPLGSLFFLFVKLSVKEKTLLFLYFMFRGISCCLCKTFDFEMVLHLQKTCKDVKENSHTFLTHLSPNVIISYCCQIFVKTKTPTLVYYHDLKPRLYSNVPLFPLIIVFFCFRIKFIISCCILLPCLLSFL